VRLFFSLCAYSFSVKIFPGMFAQSQSTCPDCGGRGTVIKKKCPHCHGSKVVDHTAHYTLEIQPGMPEGYEVVFDGEGDESPDWEAGDVVLRVRSKRDRGGWKRKETSLYWRETIGVDEVRIYISLEEELLKEHIVLGSSWVRP